MKSIVICKIINVSCLGNDNSAYHNKPHPIIAYYISKNPGCVSHAMRPGLKEAVKCILRIGSAHNKGGKL